MMTLEDNRFLGYFDQLPCKLPTRKILGVIVFDNPRMTFTACFVSDILPLIVLLLTRLKTCVCRYYG